MIPLPYLKAPNNDSNGNGHNINPAVVLSVVVLVGCVLFSTVIVSVFMTEPMPIIVVMLSFVAPTIAALLTMAHSVKLVVKKVDDVGTQLEGMGQAIDGRMTQLLKSREAQANLQGRVDEKAGVNPMTTPEIKAVEAEEDALVKANIDVGADKAKP